MEVYHKIKNIYERDNKSKKIIEGKFTDETIKFLKDNNRKSSDTGRTW